MTIGILCRALQSRRAHRLDHRGARVIAVTQQVLQPRFGHEREVTAYLTLLAGDGAETTPALGIKNSLRLEALTAAFGVSVVPRCEPGTGACVLGETAAPLAWQVRRVYTRELPAAKARCERLGGTW